MSRYTGHDVDEHFQMEIQMAFSKGPQPSDGAASLDPYLSWNTWRSPPPESSRGSTSGRAERPRSSSNQSGEGDRKGKKGGRSSSSHRGKSNKGARGGRGTGGGIAQRIENLEVGMAMVSSASEAATAPLAGRWSQLDQSRGCLRPLGPIRCGGGHFQPLFGKLFRPTPGNRQGLGQAHGPDASDPWEGRARSYPGARQACAASPRHLA